MNNLWKSSRYSVAKKRDEKDAWIIIIAPIQPHGNLPARAPSNAACMPAGVRLVYKFCVLIREHRCIFLYLIVRRYKFYAGPGGMYSFLFRFSSHHMSWCTPTSSSFSGVYRLYARSTCPTPIHTDLFRALKRHLVCGRFRRCVKLDKRTQTH